MKTIGYLDICDNKKIIHAYTKMDTNKNTRILDALKELEHLGNIQVFLLKGNKQKSIFVRKI